MAIKELTDYTRLHLRGLLSYHGNTKIEFKGPICRGLRIQFWGDSPKHNTSCVFLNEKNIHMGEREMVDIVIVNGKALTKGVSPNTNYSIGFSVGKIADFYLREVVGNWRGEIP